MSTVPYASTDSPQIAQVQDLAGLRARLIATAERRATFEEELAGFCADLDRATAGIRAVRAAWQNVWGDGSATPSPPPPAPPPGPPESAAKPKGRPARISGRMGGANRHPLTAGSQGWDRDELRGLVGEILSASGRPMTMPAIAGELHRRGYQPTLKLSGLGFRVRQIVRGPGFASRGHKLGFVREG